MDERGEEDESVVVNAAHISGLDEKTLACTPVPVIASSSMRPRDFKRPRTLPQPKVLWEDSSLARTENQDALSNESLGLIPSHLLSGMDGSELPLSSLCGLANPLAGDGSAGSSCSRENAVAGAGTSTCDSGKLLTVLKCSQMKSTEGRLVPQTLFRSLSPVPAQIEEEAEDKQAEEGLQSLQGDNFAGVLSRVTPTAVDVPGLKVSVPSAIEEGDADHTIHQVALEAEDLEELEEVCFDLDGSFSEEELDHNQDNFIPEKSSPEQPHQAQDAFPSILYKRSGNVSCEPQPDSEAVESRQESIADVSSSEYGASLVFGPSLRFDEPPSKDLGFNPFGTEPALFGEAAFGDEEFNFHMDKDGAKAFLEQDEEAFNKENLLDNQELSLMSARGTEDTFHNMTIGTYMKACSEPLGRLGNPSLRPDFGMVIQSPPPAREAPSMLVSQEVAGGTDSSVRLSPVGGSDSKVNSPTEGSRSIWPDFQSGLPLSPQGKDKLDIQSGDNKEISFLGTSANHSQTVSKADSQPTFLSQAEQDKSRSNEFPGSSKTVSCPVMDTSLAASRPSLASMSNMRVSNKTEKTDTHQRIASMTSSLQGPDNMELTFSPLQELLERSDFSVSAMGGPEQDHGEFILAFLRQRTLEKRQQAGRDPRSFADSGFDSSKTGHSKHGEDTTSLAGSKHSTEGAGGDAGRLRNPQNLDPSLHLTSSSGAANQNTWRNSLFLRTGEGKDHDVFGDETNRSLYRDQQKEAEEDRTLGLKDLTLSDIRDSVFKVPLPISSKTANNKTKPSPFRSKIPRHTGTASSAPALIKQSMSAENKILSLEPNSSVSPSISDHSSCLQSDMLNYNQSAPVNNSASVQTHRVPSSHPVTSIPTLPRSHPVTSIPTLQSVTRTSAIPLSRPVTSTSAELTPLFGGISEAPLDSPATSTSEMSIPPQCGLSAVNTSQGDVLFFRDNQRLQSTGGSVLTSPSVARSHWNSLNQQTQERISRQDDADHQARLVEDCQYLTGMTSTLDTLTEETILHTMLSTSETTLVPLVTPRTVVDLVKIPETLSMTEPCCVSLSTSALLPILNLVPRGIKCLLAVSMIRVTLEDGRQQQISPNRCPFHFKREVTLAPKSSENVQFIFQPKGQGVYTAVLEVTASSMASTGERRVYTVTLTGVAEFPTLEMWPASEKIDFGDMMYGGSGCKSIRIKNVGCATVPLCYSLFRTDSSPGLFSFNPESPAADISSISLTSRPSGAAGVINSIFSLSLPGRVEGQEVKTETVKIYCNTLALDKRDQNRYLAQAEKFYARLQVSVDQPVEELAPLATVSLRVNVGLYKLQVDTSELNICTSLGNSGYGTVKLFNTGSIGMPVRVFLETSNSQFTASPCGDVLVPPSDGSKKGCVPITVTFTPQSNGQTSREDHKVNLMFSNQQCDHYIPVTGSTEISPTRDSSGWTSKMKAVPVKLSASTMHLSFGGVHIGHTGKEKLSFTVDNDVVVFISIRQTGRAFSLFDPEKEVARESVELSAVRSKKHSVWVMFDPNTVACYSANLIIQELCGKRYTIALSGYGGCSFMQLEQVNLAHSETSFWLDMSQLSIGHSIFKKFVVRNQGSRCGFIKASFCDASRSEFLPTRATVMPSSLLLQPGEAKELLAMFCPSEKEVALCQTGHALVGIIKLEYGDNIVREMFLRYPGQQPKQVISLYDIPVPSTLREVVEEELVGMSQVPNTYSALRKSTRKINIGVFGEASRDGGSAATRHSRPSPIEPEKLETRQSLSPLIQHRSPAPSPRPALTPLNQNLSPWRSSAQIVSLPPTVVRDTSDVTHTFKNSSTEQVLSWQLDPFAPAYVKVSPGSQEVRPADHSVFVVSPQKGTLQPGMVQTVCVRFSPQQLGSYNQVWNVMDARCPGKHVQIHKFTVFAQAIQESPTRLSEDQRGARPSLPSPSRGEHEDESHTRRHPLAETDVTSSSRQSMKGSKLLSPHQMGATQYEPGNVAVQGHSATEPGDRVSAAQARQRPYWSSVEKSGDGDYLDLKEPRVVSPAVSSISGTSSAARRAGTTGSSPSSSPKNSSLNSSRGSTRGERQPKGLHLVHSTLEFPSVLTGSSSVHKLFIKNQSLQDAELSVEVVPGPPFLIKHLKFKVSCGKITIFPVTFKPRHVDKFKDKIVFRDSITGKLLTAILIAESKGS